MNRWPKILFFAIVVRPLVLVGLGLNVLNRSALPAGGPAVIAANHNSHLDTLVLMSLFPLRDLHRVRPVAAADYFLANRARAWFSKTIMGIIPLDRSGGADLSNLFDPLHEALDRNEILILFPEGSRGNPEEVGRLRKGIYHLVKDREETPVFPVVMHGLGRALPRGEALFVPFNCDVVIGSPLAMENSSDKFLSQLGEAYRELLSHCLTRHDGEAF